MDLKHPDLNRQREVDLVYEQGMFRDNFHKEAQIIKGIREFPR